MSRLLAADVVAALLHLFQNISVADLGGGCNYAVFLSELEKAQVGHYCDHAAIALQCALFLHELREDSQQLIAVDEFAVLVNCQASVCVTVKGKSHIALVLDHCLFEPVHMCRAAVLVDIGSIGLIIGHDDPCAQSLEYPLCTHARRTVSTVKTYLYAL